MKMFRLFYLSVLIGAIATSACRKTSVSATPLASLNIIHGVVNLGTVKANFTSPGSKAGMKFYSAISASIAYGANYNYSVPANQNIPLVVAPVADTMAPVLTTGFSFLTGDVYSLFLAGQAGSIDTVWIKEALPIYGDSLCGIRIIHLSYNSNPVVITQAATPTVIDFNALAYKQYSQFKTYTANSLNKSYTFQARDTTTNVILASYTLSTPYFHNVTLALIGQAGGTGVNAPKLVRINDY